MGVITECASWLARGLVPAVHLLTPDRIVIGGGVAGWGESLLRPLNARLVELCLPAQLRDVRAVAASLGYWSGVAGAGLLVHDAHATRRAPL